MAAVTFNWDDSGGDEDNGGAVGQKRFGAHDTTGVLSDRSGAGSPESAADHVVKTNSRGDAQNHLKVDDRRAEAEADAKDETEDGKTKTRTTEAEVRRAPTSEAEQSRPCNSEAEQNRRSNSDDEAANRKTTGNFISLKKVSQSEVIVGVGAGVSAWGGGSGGGASGSASGGGGGGGGCGSSAGVYGSAGGDVRVGAGSNSDENLVNSSVKFGKLQAAAAPSFPTSRAPTDSPPPLPTKTPNSPPRSPSLSDEEYEVYLPEAVEESATLFGVSQSVTPESSAESIVETPIVETAPEVNGETAETLLHVEKRLEYLLNRNDDERFFDAAAAAAERVEKEEEEEDEEEREEAEATGVKRGALIGESVPPLTSLHSVDREGRMKFSDDDDYGDYDNGHSDVACSSRTGSSLTIESSSLSDELDFDEEMQIRELLALQEGVVTAEAALALTAEEENGDLKNRHSLNIYDAWGRCLSCFKKAH